MSRRASKQKRPDVTGHRLVELLRFYHRQGRSLAYCSDPRRLNRTPVELLEYARRAGLIFEDQVAISELALVIGRRRGKR